MYHRVSRCSDWFVLALAVAFGVACAARAPDGARTAAAPRAMGTSAAATREAAFLAENDAAMTTMMRDMALKPTGDIDRDFVAMMVPHHQGAVDMAQAELRYGKNEQLRRIAQEIVIEQLQEIAAMQLSIGQALPVAVAAPTQARSLP